MKQIGSKLKFKPLVAIKPSKQKEFTQASYPDTLSNTLDFKNYYTKGQEILSDLHNKVQSGIPKSEVCSLYQDFAKLMQRSKNHDIRFLQRFDYQVPEFWEQLDRETSQLWKHDSIDLSSKLHTTEVLS